MLWKCAHGTWALCALLTCSCAINVGACSHLQWLPAGGSDVYSTGSSGLGEIRKPEGDGCVGIDCTLWHSLARDLWDALRRCVPQWSSGSLGSPYHTPWLLSGVVTCHCQVQCFHSLAELLELINPWCCFLLLHGHIHAVSRRTPLHTLLLQHRHGSLCSRLLLDGHLGVPALLVQVALQEPALGHKHNLLLALLDGCADVFPTQRPFRDTRLCTHAWVHRL
mmetsp:Transcript_47991/g.112003  ORF Transcript_47991/g.112003 Transcript_47991/m.112003 type:complete len:222 (+) Transcript_47991:654-1319(+)